MTPAGAQATASGAAASAAANAASAAAVTATAVTAAIAPAFDARDAMAALDAGLELALRAGGTTFVALSAPVVGAAVIAAAWPDVPAVAWSTSELVLVGVGVARELRGHGAARWTEVIAAARATEVAGAVVAGAKAQVGALGTARPRFVGGAAFAIGAADRAPWQGFGDAWFALPRWTYTHAPGDARATLVLAIDAAAAAHPARWRGELARFVDAWSAAASARATTQPAQPAMTAIDRGDTRAYRELVSAITRAIADGQCAKVVAARACVVALSADARVPDLLAALDHAQPECTRILIRPPGASGGALVAATPERLVRKLGDTVACDALAGTIPAATPGGDATLLASAKDRNEHELVVRAISGALGEVVRELDIPAAPGIRTLRHVLHLHTPIRGTLRDRHSHVLELAARLHPTPAVGGTPTRVACDWIAKREPTPRGWYASPVGWFDLDGDGELAVAIRSGVLVGDRVHLWAGAGIVAGSDPDRELAETDSKLRALLSALGVAQ